MSLIEALRAIVGPTQVLTDAADMAPYLTDWRQRYRGSAQAVVRPATTNEVAAVVQACIAAEAPIVPQGGNTGLVGGATPDASGHAVLLSLARMKRVREIDTANDTITVEAGCLLQQVQEAAQASGRLFPLSLAAEGSATIGGNLASNAGGTQVLRYGNARDLALGLEVVLAGGEIWHGLRGLRKDNTGYDLKHLFIGAEGTLGVITAATLKLYPLPRAQLTALAAVASLPAAVGLLEHARAGAGSTLTGFELMSAECLRRVALELPQVRLPLPPASAPWFALLELSDHEDEAHAADVLERLLGAAFNAGDATDAVIARSLAEAQALWQIRESIPEAQVRAGGNVKHDIALPVSRIASFVAATDAALQAAFPWIQPVVFGHLGDGNLHYNMAVRAGTPVTVAFAHEAEINRIVHDSVAAAGGSISAEHGLGQMKRDEIRRYKSEVELQMMRAIKQALDPRGLMNPGKLL
ncbi:MAG: FAD-binding oxidoreductase [Burkholderiaceae bacterium]|jgi:FAD/FMN-containing dehydrogenase|nr:FAD-binding oxidoreductase [Burkholderiaceae bacterium]